jgi:Na+/melibiose symporter-like transporter
LFSAWEHHVEKRGAEPLVRLSMLGNRQFTGGLVMFFFQFLIQAGLFFTIPLYLSVALGLSAIDTGIKIIPLSVTLLIAAAGIPRFFPHISPRLVVQAGLLAMFGGIVWLFISIDVHAGAEIVTVPLLLAGLGIGALASQLGSVTVSAVPDDQSPEVGGLQNTATNLGASIGTALAGSLLIAALTTSFLHGIKQNPAVPPSVSTQASTELAGGIPFLSDADLQKALTKAGASKQVTQAVLDEDELARLDGLRTALAALALLALIALFFSTRIPTGQPGSRQDAAIRTSPGRRHSSDALIGQNRPAS